MSPAISPDQSRAIGNETAPPSAPGGGNPSFVPYMVWRNRISALVIDSAEISRTVQRSLLTVYGVDTETVSTGEAAAELVYAGRSFDVIFVETNVHGVAGLQTCRKLRAMGVCGIIVALTIMPSNREKAAFMEAGADQYIEKPLTPAKFVPILVEIDRP